MVGSRWMTRARVSGAGAVWGVLGLVTVGGSLTALAPAATAGAAAPQATAIPYRHDTTTPTDPLGVSISRLSPSTLPTTGRLVITGKVTNHDTRTWRVIKMLPYSSTGSAPIRTQAALAQAAASPEDEYVDKQVDAPGIVHATTIRRLAPGDSAPFRVVVRASWLPATTAGVYWFDVRAFGQSANQPRDQLSEGRARTFLPYVPQRITDAVPTAVVVRLAHALPYADDGSLADVDAWRTSLSAGGRLRRLLDFTAGAGPLPLTWVVDPALLDAARRLADGNPTRSLAAAVRTPTASPADPASPSPTSEPLSSSSSDSGTGAGSGTSTADDPVTAGAGEAASSWLGDLVAQLRGHQVLTLPYGDVDVPAAVRRDPGLLKAAVAQRSEVLDAAGIGTSPAMASPDGYLDTASIAAAAQRTTVVASDRLAPVHTPTVVTVDGRSVVLASSGAASGGPGPSRALASVALRQRILAEAAVRVIHPDPAPLVVSLPTDWALNRGRAFFAGLRVPWLDPESLGSLIASTSPSTLDDSAVTYPRHQRRQELGGRTLRRASRLIDKGDLLERMLTSTSQVSTDVTHEALAQSSYDVRGDQAGARARLAASGLWLADRLDAVSISAPRGVTLSSASGQVPATVTNHLDQPITVAVAARSDGGITLRSSERVVELAAHSHTQVLIDATSVNTKVHNVTLMLTDVQGTPIGPRTVVPIRSTQVSRVIWLVMGGGLGVLAVAIAVRLIRRARREGGFRPRAGLR